ncbi:MAG: hypothetical protein ACR2GX_09655 [Candidatus Dormibacteria bacterium]
MSEQDVFIRSEVALMDTIDQIRDEQWDQNKPAWFQTGGQGDVSLRDIVNYHAFDSAWVPDVLAGRTTAEVGETHAGDLLGDDPAGSYRSYGQKAIAAVEELDDPERNVHLSYGDFPAREDLKHITSFRGFRAYDIAKWIGVNTQLPDDLVQGMWDEFAPEIESWRQMGVFGPAVTVPDDAPLQDRLLGLVGRDPYLRHEA